MNLVATKLGKLSICDCGFPALHDDIKLGTEYVADEHDTIPSRWICGGCHKIKTLDAVWVVNSDTGVRGYLPKELFSL